MKRHSIGRVKPKSPRLYPDLAAYLAESGDTQEHIAQVVGVTQAHVSRIAAGDTVPRPHLALRLAEYAGVPLDSFTRVHLARQHRPRSKKQTATS